MVSGSGFLLNILLARGLGLEEFGRYSVAWAVAWFVGGLNWGLILSPMMSIGPKQRSSERPAWLGAVALQQLSFSFLSFLLLWGGILLTQSLLPEMRLAPFALPLACAAAAMQLQDFLRNHFFSESRFGAALISDALAYLGRIVGVLSLLSQGLLSSLNALWIIAATAALSAFLSTFALGEISWSRLIFLRTIKRHWRFSRWIAASTVMVWISEHLFVVVSGSILGPAAAGALRATEQPLRALAILYQGLNNLLPVRATRLLLKEGPEALKAFTERIALLGFLPVGIFALAAAFWAKPLLFYLFGPEYVDSAWLLRGFSLIYLLAWFETPIMAALRALEETQVVFKATLWPALLSLALLYPLLQYQGLLGGLSLLLLATLLRQGLLFLGLKDPKLLAPKGSDLSA